MSRGVAIVSGRFDALYAGALSGGSGRGTEYAVVGQYGNPCTSWQENDAVIRPTSVHKPNRERKRGYIPDLVAKYIGPLSRVPSCIAYTL